MFEAARENLDVHTAGSGRGRVRQASALLVAIALLGAFGAPAPAQAQTSIELVSNLRQSNNGGIEVGSNDPVTGRGQVFRTGPSSAGYNLDEVVLEVDSKQGTITASELTVYIYTVSSGTPVTRVHTLTSPTTFNLGNNTLTAPALAKLSGNTNYALTFGGNVGGADVVRISFTNRSGEDSEGLPGWSIANRTTAINFPVVYRLRINGSIINTAATGAPSITGTAQVGQTLTAATTGIADADGLTSVSYTYQWIRVDDDGASNATDIEDATSATYTPVAADFGKQVKVKVSFEDDAGSDEELTSEAYPSSGTIAAAAPGITIAAGNSPVTEGTDATFTLTRSGGDLTQPFTVMVMVGESGDMVATANEGTQTVTFAADEGAARLSVASVDDGTIEANSVVTVTIVENAAYTVGDPASAMVTVEDDDVRGVTVSSATLKVIEGLMNSYTVVLDSQPTGNVTVTPASDNAAVSAGSALTFTAADWNIPQAVTVTAAQDADAANGSATITHRVTGADYGANSITAAAVAVTVEDDEPPTAESNTVMTGADADYPFTAADFNFSDANGDALSSVKIVTLPGRGTLKLGAATVDRGQSVLKARIDAGDLKYTPPRGQVGGRMSYFTFKVNDGEFDSATAYKMTIDVDHTLAGNLGQTADGTAISLPDGSYNAYAQRFHTGSSAQELEEVRLGITVPSGTTPKVSIWYGRDKPEREVTGLVLSNPSNIHTATDEVKTFKANSKTNGGHSLASDSEDYWIVVHRASGSGTISLKRTQTTGTPDAGARGWALKNEYRRRTVNFAWASSGTSFALQAELRTVPWRQLMTRVRNMEFSDPGEDNLYTNGELLQITATFSEPVTIADAKIKVPPFCRGDGKSFAFDHSGHGTNRIVFNCTIERGPHTRVHVEPNSLMPGSLGDGGRVSDAHPAFEQTTAVHGLTGPGITDVIVSAPPAGGVWTSGDRLEVSYTFGAPVTVATGSGTPVAWLSGQLAGGGSLFEVVPFDRVEGNTVVFAKTVWGNARTAFEVRGNSIYPKGGVIAGTDTGALADLRHRAYGNAAAFVAPCGSSFPDEIWCAEMTVGGNSVNTLTGFATPYGSLSRGQFDYGGSEYTITRLRHDVPQNGLDFALEPFAGNSTVNKAGFHLRVGTRSYSFPVDRVGQGSSYLQWNNTDPGWKPGDRVTVRLTGPAASAQQVEVAPPAVEGAPSVSPAGADGRWTEGETVEVTLAFSEAVAVDTANGAPSVGLGLGGPASARSAGYLRGSGTAALVFGYTLVQGDGAHTVMAITPDSLALNGGVIRSVATNADAALGHVGTLVQGGRVRTPEDPTARFEVLPERHDGATSFTVELHFSAEPEGLSYRTVQGGLLEATGGTVTGARRLTKGSNLAWEVTVSPDGAGDIALRLPARACGEANAVCVGGQPLAQAAEATVRGVPLTASFSNVPTEHDGTSPFELRFRLSEEPAGLSYRTVHNGIFDVSGGTVTRAWRLLKGNDAGWGLRVEPSGLGAVTLVLRATTDCAGTPGVCTSDGRMLDGGLAATIAGPATLAVADTEVDESEGATLDFAVSLSRALNETVTVGYGTADGTATTGADYTNTTGTLTFAAGETSKTVSVPVLDDAHDEGSETLTLTLSTPAPARVKLRDGEATGTINNTDALPQAWLARFGRTVGTHVTDAVGERLRAAPGQDSHVTVGGYRLPLGRHAAGAADPDAMEPAPTTDRLASLLTGLVGRALGLAAPPGGDGTDPRVDQPEPDPRLGQSQTLQLPTVRLRDVLLGSSFRLALGADDASPGHMRLTAWGRVAGTQFNGQDGDLTLDGDVLTGTVGVDGEWDRLLAGVAVAHSRGTGGYTMAGLDARGRGDLEKTLTSLHPYLRYAVTERLDVWGLVGYGWGDLTLEQDGAAPLETDTNFLMGAFGSRGILLAAEDTGGFQLATRTDAMLTRTTSDAVTGDDGNLAAAEADAHRLRLVLEGSRGFTWAAGRSLTPTLEVGLRHDWGDAEIGFGLELGGRVRYADSSLGLTVEFAVRGLLAHEDNDYEEWGGSGTLRLAPGPGGQGLSLTLAPTWGAASSGVDGLWSRQTTAGLAPQGARSAPTGRLNAEIGYGFPAFDTGLLTPYAGTVLTAGAARTYRLGTRWTARSGLSLTLESTRQEPAGQQPLNHGLQLQATWGF